MIIVEKESLNSAIIAFLLSANSVNIIYPIPNSVALSMMVCLGLCFYYNRKIFASIPIFVLSFLFLFFIPSFIRYGVNGDSLGDYFVRFIIMGSAGLFLSQIDFEPGKVIKYTCFFAMLMYPFVAIKNLVFDSVDNEFNYMGMTYVLLKFIICLFIGLFFMNESRKFKIFSAVFLFLYLFRYFQFAERGAYVAILFFLMLAYFAHRSYSIKIFAFLLPACIPVFIYFEKIIMWLQAKLAIVGIGIFAVDKFVMSFGGGGIDNGRFEIWGKGIDMALNSPIWGNGVAAYENTYFEGYVHNVFIQTFVEGGILLLIPFVIIFLNSLKMVFDKEDSIENRLFVAFLISSVIIPLCFSNTYWVQQSFWFYIGYVMKRSFFKDIEAETT